MSAGWAERFPLAAAGVRKLKAETVMLDYELVAPDSADVADFLRPTMASGRFGTRRITLRKPAPAVE